MAAIGGGLGVRMAAAGTRDAWASCRPRSLATDCSRGRAPVYFLREQYPAAGNLLSAWAGAENKEADVHETLKGRRRTPKEWNASSGAGCAGSRQEMALALVC